MNLNNIRQGSKEKEELQRRSLSRKKREEREGILKKERFYNTFSNQFEFDEFECF
jgi:hypothetical protein